MIKHKLVFGRAHLIAACYSLFGIAVLVRFDEHEKIRAIEIQK